MDEQGFNKLAAKIFTARSEVFSSGSATEKELAACFIRSKKEEMIRFAEKKQIPPEKCKVFFEELVSKLANKGSSELFEFAYQGFRPLFKEEIIILSKKFNISEEEVSEFTVKLLEKIFS